MHIHYTLFTETIIGNNEIFGINKFRMCYPGSLFYLYVHINRILMVSDIFKLQDGCLLLSYGSPDEQINGE